MRTLESLHIQRTHRVQNFTGFTFFVLNSVYLFRTGNWRTRDRDRVEIVGGGILEKKMLGTLDAYNYENQGMQYESRGNLSSQVHY